MPYIGQLSGRVPTTLPPSWNPRPRPGALDIGHLADVLNGSPQNHLSRSNHEARLPQARPSITAPQVKARILGQLRTARQRFAATDPTPAPGHPR